MDGLYATDAAMVRGLPTIQGGSPDPRSVAVMLARVIPGGIIVSWVA